MRQDFVHPAHRVAESAAIWHMDIHQQQIPIGPALFAQGLATTRCFANLSD